jgi:threonine efflux protein
LNCHVRSFRHKPLKEDTGFIGSVGPVVVPVRSHMNRERHMVPVRCPKDTLQLSQLRGVIDVHVGVAEVQLQPGAKVGIFRAAGDFFQRIVPQRINTAKTLQAIREQRHLRGSPVVFRADQRVFIRKPCLIGVCEAVRNGEHHRTFNARFVETHDQVSCANLFDARRGVRRRGGTEQMLVVIRNFSAGTDGDYRQPGNESGRRAHLQQMIAWFMSSNYVPALLALAGVHLMAVASPGPAFISTVQLSAQGTRSGAVAHAAGLGLAAVTWALAAMLGLNEVMLRLVWLYRLLQFVGGAYLIFCGVQAWRHSRDELVVDDVPAMHLTIWQAFRRGFATNIANPKVMVFFASIFAALVNPTWPAALKAAIPLIILVNETGYYSALALLLSTRRAQAGYQRAKTAIDRTAGSLLLAFGSKLIWNSTGSG